MFKLPEKLQKEYEHSWILGEEAEDNALRFAESIVRHCAKLCEEAYTYDEDSPGSSFAELILRAFGLEEK